MDKKERMELIHRIDSIVLQVTKKGPVHIRNLLKILYAEFCGDKRGSKNIAKAVVIRERVGTLIDLDLMPNVRGIDYTHD